MARESISKRVYCKRAVYLDIKGKPLLQADLTEALLKLRKIGNRKEILGEDGQYVRAIIYHRKYAGMLFGILASYEIGTYHLTLADDDNAEMLTVEQVAPQNNDANKRQEFIEGVCYFGISNNHIVIAPSRSLGAKPMEEYTNWILEQTDLINENNRVCFSDLVAKVTRERIKSSHVKQVEIGTPLFDFSQSQSLVERQSVANIEYGGFGMKILRQILSADQLNSMHLVDALDGNIEVTLKIRYKRTTTEKAHNVLDNIALAVRNLDEDEVKLTLDGGGTVKGSELKLSTLLNIQARNGIPNPDDLFEKMRDWLIQQIENKIIEP